MRKRSPASPNGKPRGLHDDDWKEILLAHEKGWSGYAVVGALWPALLVTIIFSLMAGWHLLPNGDLDGAALVSIATQFSLLFLWVFAGTVLVRTIGYFVFKRPLVKRLVEDGRLDDLN